MGTSLRRRQATAYWVGIAIPLILFGIVGFAIFVVIYQIGVRHLIQGINPSNHARPGSGAAIIAIFIILTILFLLPFTRILHTQWTNAGYLPRRSRTPEPTSPQKQKGFTRTNSKASSTKRNQRLGRGWRSRSTAKADAEGTFEINQDSIASGFEPAPTGLENIYSRDAFICDHRGLPLWCVHCGHWKIDRAHHCSDIGRCIRRMDHWCPWVGGIVSETNLKYFIQFCFWAGIYCVFITITTAVFLAGQDDKALSWIILVAITGLFSIFTLSMLGNTAWQASRNVTTIEGFEVETRVYHIAVLIPSDDESFLLPPSNDVDAGSKTSPAPNEPRDGTIPTSTAVRQFNRNFHTITYPIPSRPVLDRPRTSHHSSRQTNATTMQTAEDSHSFPDTSHTITPTTYDEHSSSGAGANDLEKCTSSNHTVEWGPAPRRTFAILRTKPGQNPWALHTWVKNLKEVMGNSTLEWLFPFRSSPMCDHDRDPRYEHQFGTVLDYMKQDAGIGPEVRPWCETNLVPPYPTPAQAFPADTT